MDEALVVSKGQDQGRRSEDEMDGTRREDGALGLKNAAGVGRGGLASRCSKALNALHRIKGAPARACVEVWAR